MGETIGNLPALRKQVAARIAAQGCPIAQTKRIGGFARTLLVGAGFGSVCGSSIATAATMTKVAYPSMKEHGYSGQLAAGAIAAGGTLGILIPPSTILVIYGLVTETNIGKLFAAGFIPGSLAVVMMCLTIAFLTWRNP